MGGNRAGDRPHLDGRAHCQPAGGRAEAPQGAADLEKASDAAAEDVTRFGEELQTLDLEVQLAGAQPALVQDWQRALDSYDTAKRALDMVERPDDVQHVTTAL